MRPIVLLAICIWLLGATLRVHELATLSLAGDEYYTLTEAAAAWQDPDTLGEGEQWRRAWAWRTNPLTQFLSAVAVRTLGETAFAVRLFPFLLGLVALTVLPWMMRRLAGSPAALWTLLLLATCPLHVQFCRFGRYQSATFLFGGMATLATILWARDRRPRDGVLALVAAAAAIASHVSSAILVITLVALVVLSVRPGKTVVGGLAVLGALSAFALRGPIGRTLNVIRIGIDRTGAAPGPMRLMLAGGYALGPLVLLTAALQTVTGLRRRDPTTWMLMVTGVLPALAVAVLSYTEEVGLRYLATATPSVLLLAALGAEHLAAAVPKRRVALATALCMAQVPLLASDQMDGHRHDFRAAAAVLQEIANDDDFIVAKWHANLEYHLNREAAELDYEGLAEQVVNSGASKAFAVILYQRGEPVFPDEPGWRWLAANGRLVERVGHPRLDRWLYHFELGIYEIDVEAARQVERVAHRNGR